MIVYRLLFFFFVQTYAQVCFLVHCPLREIWIALPRVRHSSRKSSATQYCPHVLYFRVSKQWYSCQRLRFLTCAQMLVRVTAHRGCADTVRESALESFSPESPGSFEM